MVDFLGSSELITGEGMVGLFFGDTRIEDHTS